MPRQMAIPQEAIHPRLCKLPLLDYRGNEIHGLGEVDSVAGGEGMGELKL